MLLASEIGASVRQRDSRLEKEVMFSGPSCIFEYTDVVTAYTRPAQTQCRQNSTVELGDGQSPIPSRGADGR